MRNEYTKHYTRFDPLEVFSIMVCLSMMFGGFWVLVEHSIVGLLIIAMSLYAIISYLDQTFSHDDKMWYMKKDFAERFMKSKLAIFWELDL